MYHPRSVHEFSIFAPDKSEVFVITCTQKITMKKWMIDPIDSSIESHQDEGNSGFIDPIDRSSDYLLDQLIFFLNQLRLE
jgi:hypothetical protein